MQLSHMLAAGLVPGLVSAAVECDFATSADSGATCASFASSWGLSVKDLKDLNPGITCPGLDTSKSYCVIGTVTDAPPATTAAPTTTFKTTTKAPAPTSDPSNSPKMPGLAGNCDRFYKVSSGDSCDVIAKKNGISTTQFKSWNSEIDDKCSNLWLDYYVCVHVPGAATTAAAPSQPTKTPSGPTPQMPGIVDNCKAYHQVKSGDSCWSIYTDAGITLAQFRSYNKQVDANCSNLWLGYYVCTAV
ncbi:hypothetical protein PG993_008851 [Apiospora rasikravindrae]|uniref:LysM domain-containing protein n=1 Tax=Apiospora rasikravindrae TaxID=990691 RepID=A0ABR1SPM0_9PEZI